jgi:hypothetical protein
VEPDALTLPAGHRHHNRTNSKKIAPVNNT